MQLDGSYSFGELVIVSMAYFIGVGIVMFVLLLVVLLIDVLIRAFRNRNRKD